MNTEASHNTRLAIVFADISGSTALYEQLGNELALQIISRTLAELTREMAAHQGTLIKTIGDEILCTFPSVASAISAACAMQMAVEAPLPSGGYPVHVRIGLHFGEVIKEVNDVFGDAVNVAARVAAITRARQIMTTRAVVDMLPAILQSKARPMMRAELRGKEEALDIYQIMWEPEDTMSTRIGMSAFRKPTEARHELIMRYRQQVITMNECSKRLKLGRGDTCNLMIHSNFASREHATLELSYGKFLFSDHSANGTYIRFSDQQIIQLHQQQLMLHGSGTISLGQPFSENATELIEYIVQ